MKTCYFRKYFDKIKCSKLKLWFQTGIALFFIISAPALGVFAYYEQLREYSVGPDWLTEVSWLLFNLFTVIVSFVEWQFESQMTKAFYRFGKFILCESCVCLSMVKFWRVSPFADDNNEVWTVSYAMLWVICATSYALMNYFNHLMLIYYTIRGTHKKQLQPMSLLRTMHIAICLTLVLGEIIVQIGSVNILEVIVLHVILFNTVDLGVKSSMSGKEYDTKSSFKTFTINIFISNRKIIAWIVLVPFIKMVVNMIYTFSSLTATSAEASASELQIDIYPQNEKFPIFAAYIMYNLCFSAARDFALKAIIEKDCGVERDQNIIEKERVVKLLSDEQDDVKFKETVDDNKSKNMTIQIM